MCRGIQASPKAIKVVTLSCNTTSTEPTAKHLDHCSMQAQLWKHQDAGRQLAKRLRQPAGSMLRRPEERSKHKAITSHHVPGQSCERSLTVPCQQQWHGSMGRASSLGQALRLRGARVCGLCITEQILHSQVDPL